MKNRIPRKLKKRYSKMNFVWNKKLGCFMFNIVDSGVCFRGTMFESKFIGGTETYAEIKQEHLDVYGKQ
jgi:hypothetical protein